MNNLEFDYPIDYELYSIKEIETIIKFLNTIEKCYTNGVPLNIFKENYKNFKNIVKAKSEEKILLKKFKNITNFDGYLCVKEMKNEKAVIKM